MKNLVILLAVILFFASCTGGKSGENEGVKKDEGRIYISGAFALYPLAVKWAEEFQKEFPGIKIDISAGGAGKGMTDVLAGMVDIAMVSREVHEDEVKNGAWALTVARDAVFPVINVNNPLYSNLKVRGLKQEEFEQVYVKGINNWKLILGADIQINVFTRSDACGAAEMWAAYCGHNQEDLKGTGVFGDPGMAEAVKNDRLALGFNNLIYLYDIKTGKFNEGIASIPIDIDGNGRIDSTENFYSDMNDLKIAIKEGKYPMPPSRNLYFVCKGKPADGPVKTFLNWVITNGIKYIDEAGYVSLPEDVINEQINKLSLTE